MLPETLSFVQAAESEAKLAKIHRTKVLDYVGSHRFTESDFMKAEPDDWKHTNGRDNYTSAEVQIGKRCHGFHMELLKLNVTPTTSHFQLIHYDVPILDAAHTVKVKGLVKNELTLNLSDIKKRPAETHPVLMACAGTGRALQKKR